VLGTNSSVRQLPEKLGDTNLEKPTPTKDATKESPQMESTLEDKKTTAGETTAVVGRR